MGSGKMIYVELVRGVRPSEMSALEFEEGVVVDGEVERDIAVLNLMEIALEDGLSLGFACLLP